MEAIGGCPEGVAGERIAFLHHFVDWTRFKRRHIIDFICLPVDWSRESELRKVENFEGSGNGPVSELDTTVF
jgi:hypothetical protein